MKVLIVHAHPEPKSMNGSLKDFAVEVLAAQGHEVIVSDLHAMAFNPAAGPDDFAALGNPDFFQLGPEQRYAWENTCYAPDIKAEQDKLIWCDLMLWQFPMYWFSLPAMLKGWVDRVLSVGFAYNYQLDQTFEDAPLQGTKAMISLTTGAPQSNYAPDGVYGHMEHLLWAIQNGILRLCGFDVLPPVIHWDVTVVDEATRKGYFEAYRERLLAIETTEPLFFHRKGDYDESGRLKPGVEPRTVMQYRADG